MEPLKNPQPQRYRAIWISDIHLGTKGCKADALLDFLRYTESEYLYLVGDIIDGWRLRKSWYWPQQHNDVVQKLLRKARKGTKVIFVPGNHDEFARPYSGVTFGQIPILRETVHVMQNGKRYLIIHGDEFDAVVKNARWLALLGDSAYNLALRLNDVYNDLRRLLGLNYWSLSAYLKHKVKNAVAYIAKFEETMADLAGKRGVDGIVCGHIHHAEIRDIEGITYCNDGDWVESCTALVEHLDGRLEILYWMDVMARREPAKDLVPTPELRDEEPVTAMSRRQGKEKVKACGYSSSPMRGFLKSTVLSGRMTRSGTS